MDSDQDFSQQIANYKPSKQALNSIKHIPLLLAAGITAAGKDTVLQRLIAKYPNDYRFTVSHATRAPRENNGVMEENGVKYYFIDKPTAKRMLDQGAFIEVNYFASNLYGASIAEIERGGADNKILVSDIDVNGIGNFVKLGLNVKPVFLLPPSFEVWQTRLHTRYGGTFNAADIHKRLQTALEELQMAINHEYFYIVINDDLDKTVELVNDIAHDRPVEARYSKAVDLAKQLADHISAELNSKR